MDNLHLHDAFREIRQLGNVDSEALVAYAYALGFKMGPCSIF